MCVCLCVCEGGGGGGVVAAPRHVALARTLVLGFLGSGTNRLNPVLCCRPVVTSIITVT